MKLIILQSDLKMYARPARITYTQQAGLLLEVPTNKYESSLSRKQE